MRTNILDDELLKTFHEQGQDEKELIHLALEEFVQNRKKRS